MGLRFEPVDIAEETSFDQIQLYQKGVRSLCEGGITKVPPKYILPEEERPNSGTWDAGTKYGSSEVDNLKLPVIDFAQLQGSNRSHAISSLAKACQDYGFFQVFNVNSLLCYHC